LALRLRNASGAKASPRDVLAALGLTESQQQEVALTRVAVEVSP
jgi:antitoxin component of RelBE/YafQ-DinJ toxin-antitoxin module